MAFGFMSALKYVDEVVMLVSGVAAYMEHKDESVLADTVLFAIQSAAKDTIGNDDFIDKVDEDDLREAVVNLVDVLEPLFE